MFKLQTRLASVLSTLSVVLLSLALPTLASAQVDDVTDAPFSFKNETNCNLTLELISVVRRDGQEVPYNVTWTVKPGQYSWLMHNNQKISGVVCTFVLRTPPNGDDRPGMSPVGFEKVSAWNWYSGGTTEHGDVCIPFSNEWLKSHLKSPTRDMLKPKFTPAIDSAAERHRQWLQHRIKYVQEAIQKDEQLLVKQKQRTEMAEGAVEAFGWLLENSPNEADRGSAPAFKGGGGGAVWLGKQQLAAIEARLKVNRALLQRYQSELKTAQSVPAQTPAIVPPVPGGYTPITFN